VIKWHSCDDKSFTPPENIDLLLAHVAYADPDVAIATWDGCFWYESDDLGRCFNKDEVKFWAEFPEYPYNLEQS